MKKKFQKEVNHAKEIFSKKYFTVCVKKSSLIHKFDK